MRKVRAIVGVCAMLLALGMVKTAAAQAPAKVAGSWEMSMAGRRGTTTETLTLEQNGSKITGTMKGGRGESSFQGTVEGSKITFAVKRQTGRGEFTTTYTGTVSGNAMKGTASMGGRFNVDWTAKRQ